MKEILEQVCSAKNEEMEIIVMETLSPIEADV